MAGGERLRVGPVVMASDPVAAADKSKRALELFRRACAHDVARGCALAAETLQDHAFYGVDEDARGAATAFDRACALGDGDSCYFMAFYIDEGLLRFVVVEGRVRELRWGADRAQLVGPLLDRACDVLHEERACKMRSERD